MKTFAKDFLLRGLLACGGGPVVLAIVYGVLGVTGTVSHFTPGEVCMGILTVTLLAFLIAGMTAIYQIERLPLPSAILIHGLGLYVAYILIYLVNGWLEQQWIPIAIFTGIFVVGYAIIWFLVYSITKAKTAKINQKLHHNT